MTESSARTSEIREMYPYLCVRDAAAAIAFYKRAFGAEELFRLTEPSGRIGHAELKLGPAILMLADEFPEYGFGGPQATGSTSVTIHLHVGNADEVARRACEAGAAMVRPPKDEFYGERSCRLRDPFGHAWLIGHHVENVTPEEMQRRYTAMFE